MTKTPHERSVGITSGTYAARGMSTPHERSVGAAMERKALRAYLRRLMGPWEKQPQVSPNRLHAYGEVLAWILSRQKRFDNRVGGLGRK